MFCLTARLLIPESLRPAATYSLRELCHRAGFGLRVVGAESANICYTVDPGLAAEDSIILRCNPRLYRPQTLCHLQQQGDRQSWAEANPSQPPDWVGGAYRLLTMLDESHVPEKSRDRRGTFFVDALPLSRRAAIQIPIVELHAEVLGDMIARRWPQLPAQARWPHEKRYAVIITHDCDHVHLSAPLEIAANLTKAAIRRSRVHANLGLIGMRYLMRPRQDPFFRFSWWREWEQQRQLRSAFYLVLHPHGIRLDLNDCKSTVARLASDWNLFRSMAESGWEFGLHAPIHMREHAWAFHEARTWLSQRVGARVTGVRHHYFALDWRRPYQSHRMHAEAGFEYDSSIAFRDAPGFRSGTCLPYTAFDPVKTEEIPLLVLPCNLMDGHIVSPNGARTGSRGRATKLGRALIDVVRNHGGVVVLNWHQESAFNQLIYAGYIDVLENLLTTFLGGDAWIATPEQVCAMWKRRARELDEGGESLPNLPLASLGL